jgi:hypothetical protein
MELLMDYWWCKEDFSAGGREVDSLGPHWSPQSFYDPDYYSPFDGPLDPARMELVFRPKDRRPIIDFVSFADQLVCKPKVFTDFGELLGDSVRTFPIKIGTEAYLIICAHTFFDLLDFDKSKYHLTDEGTPYRFSEVILKEPPPEPIHLFGLSNPRTIVQKHLVSDEFKRRYEELNLVGLKFKRSWPS